MARENAKRATMKDLIARKMQREAEKFKTVEVYVPSMDRMLPFKTPGDTVLMDTIDEMGDGESTRKMMEAMKRLIYQTCELLQNPELHQELEVTDPFDTVDAIFSMADLNAIGQQLTGLFGLGEVEESLKNESRATGN